MNKHGIGILIVAICLALAPQLRAESILDRPFDLKFTAVDGKVFDLAQLRGKVVLIDFWATWCPACRASAPDMVAIYNKYRGQGLEIVGVSLDQDKDQMLAFAKDEGMTWPQYFDGQGWDNAVSSKLGVSQIPIILLVGRDGKLVPPTGDGDLPKELKKALSVPQN